MTMVRLVLSLILYPVELIADDDVRLLQLRTLLFLPIAIARGSRTTTCAKTYPRAWILVSCLTCTVRSLVSPFFFIIILFYLIGICVPDSLFLIAAVAMQSLLGACQGSVRGTRPMFPPAAASFVDLDSAPKEVVANLPGAASEMLKAGSRLVLRRQVSCSLYYYFFFFFF
jgi:hypothetical protein